MSRQTALIFLVLLCLFHLVVNGIYLPLDEYPPSYDPAFHLNISMTSRVLASSRKGDDGMVDDTVLSLVSKYPAALPNQLHFHPETF